jgi:hypothetical protein
MTISIVNQTNPYEMATIGGKVIEQVIQGADEHTD